MTEPGRRHAIQTARPITLPAPQQPSATGPATWASEAAQLLREAIRDWPTTLRLAFLLAVLGITITTALR